MSLVQSASSNPDPLRKSTTNRQKNETQRRSFLEEYSSEIDLLILSTLIKLFLFPSYHSTDFEVHRNWLAITKSLPIHQWYFDKGSEWTLDYPPFFAYFSYFISIPSKWFDLQITDLQALNHQEWSTKVFMRLSVLITEGVMVMALFALNRSNNASGKSHQDQVVGGRDEKEEEEKREIRWVLIASLLFHPGLIIVDHIHFQYNGFLYGVLLWSIWAAREGKPLLCAFFFASLLNFKHIYMYIAPAFFIYLLRSYILPPGTTQFSASFERLLNLGTITLIPFALSLGPLLLSGFNHSEGPLAVLSQMLSRLFPFNRGVNHAYWAANLWSLYTFSDRFLLFLIRKKPNLVSSIPIVSSILNVDQISKGSLESASRGLIGDTNFAILPNPTPKLCFVLTLLPILIYLTQLWFKPTYKNFLASITLCGFSSFLFGWHVHEKAILLILIPFTLSLIQSSNDYFMLRSFQILTLSGTFALFPLLFEGMETILKFSYTSIWTLILFTFLKGRIYRPMTNNLGFLIHALESVYLMGFIPILIYVELLHPMMFNNKFSGNNTKVEEIQKEPSIDLVDSISNDSQNPIQLSINSATSLLGIKASSSENQIPTPSNSMEFLPLMIISVYCALGVVWSWLRFSYAYLYDEEEMNPAGSGIKGISRSKERERERKKSQGLSSSRKDGSLAESSRSLSKRE